MIRQRIRNDRVWRKVIAGVTHGAGSFALAFSSEGVSCFRPFDALDRYWMCPAAVDPVPAGYGH